MAKVPEKILVVVMDSTVHSRVFDWSQSGQLPTLSNLIQNGVFCKNAFAFFPTVTAPNWASLCTGTWPGVHGVTDQVIHLQGEPLDMVHEPPSMDELPVETIWQAAERAGKRTIVMQPSFVVEATKGAALIKSAKQHLAQTVDRAKQEFSTPWGFCFIHLDLLEKAQQAMSAAQFGESELALHQTIDDALGELIQAAGQGTLVVVTATHGFKEQGRPFQIAEILEKSGLLTYLPGKNKKIDWSRTQVVPVGTSHLFVNLKGRDPEGIVETGQAYEQLVDKVITILLQYIDPDSGLGPVRVALKRDDARVLGVWGDKAGDVVYAMDPRFGGAYGPYLTTARFKDGDLKGMLIMAGPGVKKGEIVDRPFWPMDIVPTLCYIAEMAEPRDSEGAVIYQALEEPSGQGMQIFGLKKELQRLKKIVDKPMMC